MDHEDFKIIIKKNGEIWVDLGNMDPQRIRHYKDILEEAIGPVKGELVISGDAGSSGGVYVVKEEEETDREQIKEGG